MRSTLLTLAGSMWAWAGFGALAIAMTRHFRDVVRADIQLLPYRVALRAVGWSALTLSWIACEAAQGAAIGATMWFGVLTVAVIAVALSLSYWPRVLRYALPIACAAGTVLGCWAY